VGATGPLVDDMIDSPKNDLERMAEVGWKLLDTLTEDGDDLMGPRTTELLKSVERSTRPDR
jgi:hypothetical protein